MKVLVFHRVAVFAAALARHLQTTPSISTITVVDTEAKLARALATGHHDVVLFARADMVRCLMQWQHRDVEATGKCKLVLAAPVVFAQLVAEARQLGIDAVLDVNLPAEQFAVQLGEVVIGRRGLPELSELEHDVAPVLELPVRPIAYHDATDIEIVRLLATGLSDKEIATTVFLSGQTVRNRISRILQESHLENRTQLTAIYLRHEFFHLLA